MKNASIQKFQDWLINKQLSSRTIEGYLYYYLRFTKDDSIFNQESASKFYSKKANRHSIGKAFLINFRKFLMENHKELKIPVVELGDIAEMDLSSFKVGKAIRLVRPIAHEDIQLLEKYLPSERLKIQLQLTYSCGLRLGEALKVRFRNFNWSEWGKDMTKMGECRVMGKGGKPGIAIVPGPLMNRIAHFFKSKVFNPVTQDSLLFVKNTVPDEEINVKSKSSSWQRHLGHAGVKSGLTKLDGKGNIGQVSCGWT